MCRLMSLLRQSTEEYAPITVGNDDAARRAAGATSLSIPAAIPKPDTRPHGTTLPHACIKCLWFMYQHMSISLCI
jgi:hypothetical protein